ncbi:hypothetical protein H6G76_33965 [Nostoc sp. FACHB-152]|uniref:hypothetical protein n=1 Tax=unclassified Nostoc TaxID=2593658 RepID=UPI001685C882|nr:MULTISPECIES: hypothetical protein [unclassified Nostoc]MBD2452033.1 hypothetical protein [Nostoc sp. FACHB-152]MBD2469856.1 hypothetical protein [Nostoc sp. FACHB-145]
MIHHISIAVKNPLLVAQALAELWNGNVYSFSPILGGYIVRDFDEHGTAVEIYPLGTQLAPMVGNRDVVQDSFTPKLSPFHAAISVSVDQERIEQIAKREGWFTQLCDRGPFKVIEFWVENQLLLELLPPALASEYLKFTQPQNTEKFFGTPVTA